ncbi:cellulose binding domain-containing protein [Streptomyces sp. NPDC058603]|uniref:cellulose binding domain-containing protein n=1 Tax=Streptomyces sp. NPDC058603 TaxID=3346551 RepID=UPI0036543043
MPRRRSVVDGGKAVSDLGLGLWEDELGPVLAYARMCTRSRAAGVELAAQAVDCGRARASPQSVSWADELPSVPRALRWVLDTAVVWSTTDARREHLAPALLRWLEDSGAQESRRRLAFNEDSLALRGLRALAPSDGELFWWSRVEAVPVPELARRLGRSSQDVSAEADRVAAEFRERCWSTHRLELADATCRSYSGMLDAMARESAPSPPSDLPEHLGSCERCAEALTCLSVKNASLPMVLAEAALRWRGPAYVARRRKHPAVAASAAPADTTRPLPPPGSPGGGAGNGPRPSVLVGAVTGVVLILAAAYALRDDPVVESGPPSDASPPRQERTAPLPPTEVPEDMRTSSPSASMPESPSPSASSPSSSSTARHEKKPPAEKSPASRDGAGCTTRFAARNTWPDGVQADLLLQPGRAVPEGWVVTFDLAPGARVDRLWHGRYATEGSRVSVRAVDYNRTFSAGATVTVGVVLQGYPGGAWVSDVRMNGRSCRSTA